MGSTAVPVQLWEVSGDDSRGEEEEEYLVFYAVFQWTLQWSSVDLLEYLGNL